MESPPEFPAGFRLKKSLAEFAAKAAKEVEIIFCRGVYLAENTAQAASVEFVCHRQANYARSRLQKLAEKAEGLFRQVQSPPVFRWAFCVYYHRVMEMKRNWKTYLGWIALAEGVGALAGWLTREGTEFYKEFVEKPALAPPAIVFPIVWGILYALMGFGAARVSMTTPSTERSLGLNLFVAQLVVNFFWSLIFFNLRTYGFALAWLGLLWVLIVWMILAFRKTDGLSAWLQVPYLLWVSFAAYLNWSVWVMN